MTAHANLRRLFGALTSGLLLVLVFPAPDLGWLVWIALVPLLLALHGLNPGRAFRLGYLTGLVAFGGLMTWITLFGTPAWVLLTAGMALYLGIFAATLPLLTRDRRDAMLWAVPLAWVAVEVLRSIGPLGFPWGLLGLTQYRTPTVLPLASIAGVFGISGVIALVNVIIANLIVTLHAERRLRLASALAVLAAVALLAAGAARPAPPSAVQRVVAAVQPNVPPRAKGDPTLANGVVAGLLRQTAKARAEGAEIIVYPETAIPTDLGAAPDLRATVGYLGGGAVVVAGSFLSGPRNAVFVLDRDGRILGRYVKRRLVPFGEAGIQPGDGAAPVATPAGSLALAICYESAFPNLIRPLVAGGADLIAILTNDGWFGTSAGPAQHAANAVLRAVETGRSVIRAANTGTSMLIRPDGAIVGVVPLGTAGVVTASMPVGGPLTPYVRWGWLVAPVALAVWMAGLAPAGLTVVRRHPAAAWNLAAAIAVPAVPWLANRVLAPDLDVLTPVAAAGILLASVLVGRGRLLCRRGVLVSLGASLVVTGVLILVMSSAYARYGLPVPLGPPPGNAVAWGMQRILSGIALEAWLRGAVFAAAVPLGGWGLGIVSSTLLGIVLRLGAPQEVLFWSLLTGVGYGALRAWTGDAVGLGPARGLGDAAIFALSGLR